MNEPSKVVRRVSLCGLEVPYSNLVQNTVPQGLHRISKTMYLGIGCVCFLPHPLLLMIIILKFCWRLCYIDLFNIILFFLCFHYVHFLNCNYLASIVVILCVFVYLICICCILCVFVVLMCICCTYVYLLYLCVFVVLLCVFVVLCVYCCSYFRCRTAG